MLAASDRVGDRRPGPGALDRHGAVVGRTREQRQVRVERHGAQIVLVGTAVDGAEAVAAAMTAPALNLTGQTTLPQLAALLGQCDLFLGADSGVMHMAAAARTPVVALFGPSNPQAWGPWTPAGRSTVVRLGLPCSPCSYVGHSVGWRNGCWHRSCMADLQPEQVLQAAETMLAHGRGR